MYRYIALLLAVVLVSPSVAQRSLRWNVGSNHSFDSPGFRAINADTINFACGDDQLSQFFGALSQGYVQGDDTIAQATYSLAICSYLRPSAANAGAARIKAISNLKAVVSSYRPFSSILEGSTFRRYCYTYDLLKPDLDTSTQQSFARLVGKLISDATAWLKSTKTNIQRDNYASNIAAMRGICAQTINNSSSVAETISNFISPLLSTDERVSNIYQNGTSYDFFGRDALFYHLSTVSNYVELALRMPDGFFSNDQWRRIERATYFVKQFYLPACLPKCVYHREFMTTQYSADKTTLHPDLYNTTWPGPNNGFSPDSFLQISRIPFVSVRPWTKPLASLVHFHPARALITLSRRTCVCGESMCMRMISAFCRPSQSSTLLFGRWWASHSEYTTARPRLESTTQYQTT